MVAKPILLYIKNNRERPQNTNVNPIDMIPLVEMAPPPSYEKCSEEDVTQPPSYNQSVLMLDSKCAQRREI